MSEEKMLPCPVCGGTDLKDPTDEWLAEADSHWVTCYDCGCCGPCEESSEIAVYSWNSMPRAHTLCWTKEPPKEPGWYWVRFDGNEVRMLEIRRDWLKTVQKITEWEWAGPIPEPREK